jgi:hypothetical protein
MSSLARRYDRQGSIDQAVRMCPRQDRSIGSIDRWFEVVAWLAPGIDEIDASGQILSAGHVKAPIKATRRPAHKIRF